MTLDDVIQRALPKLKPPWDVGYVNRVRPSREEMQTNASLRTDTLITFEACLEALADLRYEEFEPDLGPGPWDRLSLPAISFLMTEAHRAIRGLAEFDRVKLRAVLEPYVKDLDATFETYCRVWVWGWFAGTLASTRASLGAGLHHRWDQPEGPKLIELARRYWNRFNEDDSGIELLDAASCCGGPAVVPLLDEILARTDISERFRREVDYFKRLIDSLEHPAPPGTSRMIV